MKSSSLWTTSCKTLIFMHYRPPMLQGSLKLVEQNATPVVFACTGVVSETSRSVRQNRRAIHHIVGIIAGTTGYSETAHHVMAASGSNHVQFTMQQAAQTEWCWCAVAVSVSLKRNPGSGHIQCDVADAVLGRTDCCANGAASHCNRPARLSSALHHTGNLKARSGHLSETEVVQRLGNQNVIPSVIDKGTKSHAVVINSCYYRGGVLVVGYKDPDDPQNSQQWVDYPDFVSDPSSGDTWSDAFEIQ
jgi:hypothetical protein